MHERREFLKGLLGLALCPSCEQAASHLHIDPVGTRPSTLNHYDDISVVLINWLGVPQNWNRVESCSVHGENCRSESLREPWSVGAIIRQFLGASQWDGEITMQGMCVEDLDALRTAIDCLLGNRNRKDLGEEWTLRVALREEVRTSGDHVELTHHFQGELLLFKKVPSNAMPIHLLSNVLEFCTPWNLKIVRATI